MYIDIEEMKGAFVVLMKRHNLTPLSIPREEVSWYSDYSGMTDGEPNDIGGHFHSSSAKTNEEFVARGNRRKQEDTIYKQDGLCTERYNEKIQYNANARNKALILI